jgi:hypothetical protein
MNRPLKTATVAGLALYGVTSAARTAVVTARTALAVRRIRRDDVVEPWVLDALAFSASRTARPGTARAWSQLGRDLDLLAQAGPSEIVRLITSKEQ